MTSSRDILILICTLFGFAGCIDKKNVTDYPMIDVINNIGNYQRVYCSEYFSSIELIPLETRENCLLDVVPVPHIRFKEDRIFMHGNGRLYTFDRSGKFLNQIGERGQGPGEYQLPYHFFISTDKSIIYIEDSWKILKYDFNGNFINSFHAPIIDDKQVSEYSYVGDSLFVGQLSYDGKNRYKYCLFDANGDTVKCFPSHIFFERTKGAISFDGAFPPIRVDDRLYLKDYVNDTIYLLEDLNLSPVYVFDFGQYSFTKEHLEIRNLAKPFPDDEAFAFFDIIGTPKFFFYKLRQPNSISGPNVKQRYDPIARRHRKKGWIYGVYDIDQNVNRLLDSDKHLEQGIANDLNGGLPVIPRYYAGNNIVIDIWYPEEMKERLTDGYFASQTIKDRQAHQKLKDILKNLKDDDNPVVVIAKLK